MYKSKELKIDPEFQRLFRWPEGAQSRLIESLVLELPLPPIYMLEVQEGTYELIDGLQRISSYLHFRGELIIDGEKLAPLELVDCDIVPELNGLTYEQLPRAIEIKLKRNFIRAEILRKESDPRLRYYMFKRLNTGGARLEDQEIRNCTIRLLSNDFNALLVNLSQNQDFVYCIDTVADAQVKKKYDQELVLRFFAFKNARADYKHAVGDFLTEYMEQIAIGAKPFDGPQESALFAKTFAVIRAAAETNDLKEKVFAAVDKHRRQRGQFSVYHFEALTLGLQSALGVFNASDSAQMQKLGRVLTEIKASDAMRDLTGGGKNDPNPVRDRINLVERKIAEAFP
jgi:hypothetical protein